MKVLITRKIPKKAEEILRKNKFEVYVHEPNRPIKPAEFLKYGADADAVLCLLSDKIDESLIKKLPKCKIIANYAVGYNNIDIEAAKKNNIVVTNTPGILTDATADLAMALILSCSRHIVESDRFTKQKRFKGWEPELYLGIELRGKTLGIIGAGRIGQAVAKRAAAFGMKVIYFNKSRKSEFEKEVDCRKVNLNTLLKKSDVISLHLPLTTSTFHLMNSSNMRLLKETAILVNTARGEVVDEKYLIELLKNKMIFSAGFDVYENEPKLNPDLYKLPNVVLLPHIGSATFETRSKMAEVAANNIVQVLKGKSPINPVY